MRSRASSESHFRYRSGVIESIDGFRGLVVLRDDHYGITRVPQNSVLLRTCPRYLLRPGTTYNFSRLDGWWHPKEVKVTFGHEGGGAFNSDQRGGHTPSPKAEGFQVKDSGQRASFASGMVRDVNTDKPLFHLLLPLIQPFKDTLFHRIVDHMTKGAKKYSARNWEQAKGQEELDRFRESAMRHFFQWFAGDRDEDHAAAVFFNIMGAEYVRWRQENGK